MTRINVDKTLEGLANVPFDADVLKSLLTDVKATDKKLLSLERQAKIVRLKRNMYVVSPDISRDAYSLHLIANHLCTPSYVSCLTALRYYGLIPERVFTVQSMTIKRSRTIENSVGRFEYFHADSGYYSIGIQRVEEDGVAYLMASPAKALCDLIVTTPYLNLRYMRELEEYLEDDIRLDMDGFKQMDVAVFEACAAVGKKRTMMKNLIKLLKS